MPTSLRLRKRPGYCSKSAKSPAPSSSRPISAPHLDAGYFGPTYSNKPPVCAFQPSEPTQTQSNLLSWFIESTIPMNTNNSFLKSGHLPTLFSAFLYFDVSFMIWVLLGALGNYVA